MREGSQTSDMIMGLLQVSFLSTSYQSSFLMKETKFPAIYAISYKRVFSLGNISLRQILWWIEIFELAWPFKDSNTQSYVLSPKVDMQIFINCSLCWLFAVSVFSMILCDAQACYIRKSLLLNIIGRENILEGSDSGFMEWDTLMKESKKCAEVDLNRLVEKMLDLGWASKNVLLSNREQARYSFVADWGIFLWQIEAASYTG